MIPRTHLLPETYPRTGVERKEDVRVGDQILVQPIVKEAIWVELECCVNASVPDSYDTGGKERTIRTPQVLAAVHDKHRVQDARVGGNVHGLATRSDSGPDGAAGRVPDVGGAVAQELVKKRLGNETGTYTGGYSRSVSVECTKKGSIL